MTTFTITEKTSGQYTADLVDELGVAVPGANLTTLILTLYDLDTDTIVNGRNGQNVLNANGVTVDVAGHLVWTIAPADTTMVTAASGSERHRAIFVATWNGGAKSLPWEVELVVQNLLHLS